MTIVTIDTYLTHAFNLAAQTQVVIVMVGAAIIFHAVYQLLGLQKKAE